MYVRNAASERKKVKMRLREHRERRGMRKVRHTHAIQFTSCAYMPHQGSTSKSSSSSGFVRLRTFYAALQLISFAFEDAAPSLRLLCCPSVFSVLVVYFQQNKKKRAKAKGKKKQCHTKTYISLVFSSRFLDS
jgi:hypothetical protein